MVALQLAICVSSRVNDARTAQQLGVFVILPIPGAPARAAVRRHRADGAGDSLDRARPLSIVNAGLMWFAIRLFDRETILTRWK